MDDWRWGATVSNAALINGLVTPHYGLVAVGRPLPVADDASASAG
jgi:hypothetical protein